MITILMNKKPEPLTPAIANKGFSGTQSFLLVKSFVYLDREVHRKPLLAIAANVSHNLKYCIV
jgi:hypothetical protein